MRKWKVYLSSTYKDLAGKRAVLIDYFEKQLKGSFELTIIMERMYDDGSHTAFELDCKKQVQLCDIYILIQGNSIGSYIPKTTTTYTELELDTAIRCEKKLFILQLDPFDEEEIGKENISKHEELIKKFKGKPTHFFYDLDSIKLKFLECLTPFINTQPINKISPYKGLDAFEVTDGAYFFGRTSEKKDFFKKIIPSNESNRLIAVIGNSGIGKTSFIKAGILYDLAHQSQYGYNDYKQIIITPGGNSFTNLMYELQIGGVSYTTRDVGIVFDQKVILFFNQFEEVITQSTTTEALEERNKLFDFLNKIQTQNVLIITTFRSDYLSALCNFEFIKSPPQIYFPLSSLDYSVSYSNWKQSIEEIIIAPAALNGITFESELVTKLTNEIKEVDGSLPILQLTLQKLWTPETIADGTITIAEYEKISRAKGIAGIIEQHAEEVYHSITANSPTTENLFRLLFINLVEVTESKTDVRKTIAKDQLLNKLQVFDSKEVTKVFEKLLNRDSRLIITYESSGVHCVNIIHEVLIRKWERLKQWINERRSSLEKEKEFELWATKYLKSSNPKFLLNNNQLEEINLFRSENQDLVLSDKIEKLSKLSQEVLNKVSKREKIKKYSVVLVGCLLISLGYYFWQLQLKEQFIVNLTNNESLNRAYEGANKNLDSISSIDINNEKTLALMKDKFFYLKNLNQVYFSIQIKDFSCFNNNTLINTIQIVDSDTMVTNFDEIKKLKNLKKIKFNCYKSKSVLERISNSKLNHIHNFSIINSSIVNFKNLRKKNIVSLELNNNNELIRLTGLEKVKDLERISIIDCPNLENIDALNSLRNLKSFTFLPIVYLDTVKRQDYKIKINDQLKYLNYFEVSTYNLPSLKELDKLIELDSLALNDNFRLNDLKENRVFQEIVFFGVINNGLFKNISDVPSSVKIKTLQLDSNANLTDLKNIEKKFPNLTTLLLYNNFSLNNFDGIEKLNKLQRLEIFPNYLDFIDTDLSKVRNLKELVISSNVSFDKTMVKKNNPGIKIEIIER